MTPSTAPQPVDPPAGIHGHGGAPPTGRSPWRTAGIVAAFLLLFLLAFGIGFFLRALKAGRGERQSANSFKDMWQIATNPRDGFPGKDRVTIACMGIDDNWTNSDEVYTAGARTDTLFLMTLDFDNKKATMLSIPRDSYVPIAGERYADKINAAYASGGPARTEATIRQWLGVSPDYYVVLNIDATKKMVDALGGVDLNVEHAMDYDDEWGHLHVHLRPGFQHLDGDQAVGFARFRHANHGVTPEDGDERRIYRQHILLRAMIDKAKTPEVALKANSLLDTAMACIRTDMTRAQLFDLAAIFHGVDQQNDVVTAQIPGQDGRSPHGAYVMLIDDQIARQYADWLVHGNDSAGRALTPVVVQNATAVPGLAAKTVELLRNAGFSDTRASATAPADNASTTIIDGGVANHAAACDIAGVIGLPNTPVNRQVAQPNKLGWAPPPTVTVLLGKDYAAAANARAGTSP